jgi:hypothetical protein
MMISAKNQTLSIKDKLARAESRGLRNQGIACCSIFLKKT